MPKHERRITFYWIICEVNTIYDLFMSYYERKFLLKKPAKNMALKLVPGSWWAKPPCKWNFWNKLIDNGTCNRRTIMSKSACIFPQIPFYGWFFENKEGLGISF